MSKAAGVDETSYINFSMMRCNHPEYNEASESSRPLKRKSTLSIKNVAKKSKSEESNKKFASKEVITRSAGEPSGKVTRRKNQKEQINQAVNYKKVSTGRKKKDEPDLIQWDDSSDNKCEWDETQLLAQLEDLPYPVADGIINLFNQDCTIPFIARYRCHVTRNLSPDKLRKIKATYQNIQKVKEKADKLIEVVSTTSGSAQVIPLIRAAQTLEELDFLGAPYKKDSKRTLAERARQLGLEKPALLLLQSNDVDLRQFVDCNKSELDTFAKVRLGVQHIIADIISKDPSVQSCLKKISSSKEILLRSKFSSSLDSEAVTLSKYDMYGDFEMSVYRIQPHHTLAINRGESEKELSVKVVIPDHLWQPVIDHCKKKLTNSKSSLNKLKLITDAVDDCIKRLLSPLLVRQIRSRLTDDAEVEAIKKFGSNLKQLLLMRPCDGHVIMGIDPGFKSGCKLAVISEKGEFLKNTTFNLNKADDAKTTIVNYIRRFRCELIALGNGTACRETEVLLKDVLKENDFYPRVVYSIVSEQGVSIYSCSPEAAEEFPDLHPTVVGAISLARRLQNPLSELVKVEPKHLGVGMYQHDVKKQKLLSTLDDIVSECVSFVGVDVNTASFHLLKRIAGLKSNTAQEIINYRSANCTFKTRDDLMKVKGIKTKTFQQCAGFLRVLPSTAKTCTRHSGCQKKLNPLDETAIHPESYEKASKIMSRIGVNPDDLGNEEFIARVKSINVRNELGNIMAKEFGCSVLELQFIIETLQQPKNYDLRAVSLGPVFRSKIKAMEELHPGQILEGVVRNTVTFGAFVDVGIGKDALLHTSKMNNSTVQLNDRVEVEIIFVDFRRERVQLKLRSVITGT